MILARMKKGATCPVAALAGKTQCLGKICAWHLPETKTGCLVLEINNRTIGLGSDLKDIGNMVDAAKKKVELILDNQTKGGRIND